MGVLGKIAGKVFGRGTGKVIKEATKDMGFTGKLLKPVLRFLTGNRFTRWFGKKLIIKPIATIGRKLGFGKAVDKVLAYIAKGSLGGLMLSGVAGMGAIAMLKKFFGMGKSKDSPNADGSIPESAKPDPAEDNKLDKDLNTEDNLEKFNRLSSERKLAESNRKLQELKVEIDKAKVNREKALSQKIDANDPSQVENKFSQVSSANAQVTDAVNKRLEIIDERLQQNKKAIDQANENIVKINKSLSEKLKGVYKSLKDKLTVDKDKSKGGILAWIGKTLGTIWNAIKAISGILAITAGAAVVKGRDKLMQGWKSLTSGVKDFFGYSDKDSTPKSAEKAAVEVEKSPDPPVPSEDDSTSKTSKDDRSSDVKDDKTSEEGDEEDEEEKEKEEQPEEASEDSPDDLNPGAGTAAMMATGAIVGRKVQKKVAKKAAEKAAVEAEKASLKFINGKWYKGKKFASKADVAKHGYDWKTGKAAAPKKPGLVKRALSWVWNKTGKKVVQGVKNLGNKLLKKLLNTKFGKIIFNTVIKNLAKVAGKGALKSILKKVPFVGALAGLVFGAQKAMKGDWVGAGMEVASGLLSLAGPVGMGAAIALDAATIARDMKLEARAAEKGEEIKTGNPRIDDNGNLIVDESAIPDPENPVAKVDKPTKTEQPKPKVTPQVAKTTASKSQGGFVAKQDTTKQNPQNQIKNQKIPVKKVKAPESDSTRIEKKVDRLANLIALVSEENRSQYNATTSRAWTVTGRQGDMTGTSM